MKITQIIFQCQHGLWTPGEQIAFTALQGQKSTPTTIFLGTKAYAIYILHCFSD